MPPSPVPASPVPPSPCARWLATLATDVDAAIGAALWFGELGDSEREGLAEALDAVADGAGIPKHHRRLFAVHRWEASGDGGALVFTRGDVAHRAEFAEDGALSASSVEASSAHRTPLPAVPFAVAQQRLARGILAARRRGAVAHHRALMPLLDAEPS